MAENNNHHRPEEMERINLLASEEYQKDLEALKTFLLMGHSEFSKHEAAKSFINMHKNAYREAINSVISGNKENVDNELIAAFQKNEAKKEDSGAYVASYLEKANRFIEKYQFDIPQFTPENMPKINIIEEGYAGAVIDTIEKAWEYELSKLGVSEKSLHYEKKVDDEEASSLRFAA
ncbi:hypothetical protein K9L27_00665 [Candidatus Gracilibacteria bacterium]|nr:hypothetical protein [Candidatus Gracilibacteria bacterium]